MKQRSKVEYTIQLRLGPHHISEFIPLLNHVIQTIVSSYFDQRQIRSSLKYLLRFKLTVNLGLVFLKDVAIRHQWTFELMFLLL